MRLNDYERFPDQAIIENGELIEEAIMVKAKSINHVQALYDENCKAAMVEELKAIEKNQTWELVESSSKKTIYVRWIYKLKLKPDGEIVKYKAKLVAKGFLQRPRVEFNEVYAHVARLETIRLVVAISTYKS